MNKLILFFIFCFVKTTLPANPSAPIESIDLFTGQYLEQGEEALLAGDFEFTIARIFDPESHSWKFNWPCLFQVDGEKIKVKAESPIQFTYDANGLLAEVTIRNEGKTTLLEFREVKKGDWHVLRDGKLIYQYYFEGPLLKKIISNESPSLSYSYSKEGDRITEKRIGDAATLFEYDQKGRIAKIKRPSALSGIEGHILSLQYGSDWTALDEGSFGRKVYSFTPEREVYKVETYDKSGLVLLEEFTRSKGLLTQKVLSSPKKGERITYSFTYDNLDRLILEQVEKNGKSYSHTIKYDGEFPCEEATFSGETIYYIFDKDSKKLIEKGILDGPTSACTYNNLGEEIEVLMQEGPNSYLRKKSYSQKMEIEEHYFNGEKKGTVKKFYSEKRELLLEQKFDDKGNLCEEFSYVYDESGRLIQKEGLEGSSEISIFNEKGDLERVILNGEENRFHYDKLHRLISEDSGISFSYDAKGRKISETDPEGNATVFIYDVLGRVSEVRYPKVLNEWGEVKQPCIRYGYDVLGNITEETDPLGHVTHYIRDGRGEIEKIYFPDGGQEVRHFAANGRLESIEKRNGEVVEYERKNSITPPSFTEKDAAFSSTREALKRETTTNSLGQKVRQTRLVQPNGIEAVKTYDALGRIVLVEAIDATGTVVDRKEFGYTLAGDLSLEQKPGFSIRRIFGPMHRVEKVIEKRGDEAEMATFFRYNAKGLFENILKNDGISLSYSYDDRGMISRLYSSDGTVDHRFTLDASGRIIQTSDFLGQTERTYDPKGALVAERLSSGAYLQKVFNTDGKAEKIFIDRFGSIDFTYQEDNITVTRHDVRGNCLFTKSASFDVFGKIETLGGQKFSYNEENKLSSIFSLRQEQTLLWQGENLVQSSRITQNGTETHQYAFDSQFRVVAEDHNEWEYHKENLGPTSKNGEAPLLRKDAVGNIVYLNDGERELHLGYDALGRLITLDNGEKKFEYMYDGFNRRIAKKSAAGVQYFLYDGLFEIGSFSEETLLDLKITLPSSLIMIGLEWNNQLYDVEIDFKGSPISLIQEETIWNEAYSVFGKPKEGKLPYGYTGKRQDAESGLLYFGSRFYSPSIALFITPDPKGTLDGLNPYQFAHFNPLYYSDPFGNRSFMDGLINFFHEGFKLIQKGASAITGLWSKLGDTLGITPLFKQFSNFAEKLLGKGFLLINGSYIEESHKGIYGDKEIASKARVTFMHGILTLRSHLIDNLHEISSSHGGIRVHYVFRPSLGFTRDLLQCMLVKMGWVSEEARELLAIWKNLIEEMGGVHGGGKIIHYAHSLGGADTFNALQELSQEEQVMIDIRTFGSATLIENSSSVNAVNYVSKRDGVPFIANPIRYCSAWFGKIPNVFFIGESAGLPFIDHLMLGSCYHDIMKNLGQAFVTLYGTATL